MKSTNKHAFSLIELLAVVAIVGMVAALLLPVFARVREEGRRVVCVSNLRQIAAGVSMYTCDDDGVFLPTAQNGEKTVFWPTLLQSYVKNDAVFHCPDDDSVKYKAYGNTSYGINAHLSGVGIPIFRTKSLPQGPRVSSSVVRPSGTVLIADSGTIPIAGTPIELWPAMLPSPPEIGDAAVMSTHSDLHAAQNSALPAPRARHSGRTNVLWVDGHVTTATVASIYTSPGNIALGETVPGLSPCFRPERGCQL